MRPYHLCWGARNQRDVLKCNCGLAASEDLEDAELKKLFQDMALALFDLMDPDDAVILARSELHGETLSEIATHLRCSKAETSRRLGHAQRNFCQLVVLILSPAKPE